MIKHHCKRCDYNWIDEIKSPLFCLSCKSNLWHFNLDNSCELCEKHFELLHTHHKDGNRNNNQKNNLIKICNWCHSFIHMGRKDKKIINKNIELIWRLKSLRTFWVKSKEVRKTIFQEIDKAIEETKKSYPVPMKDSDFLKRYLKIKENYL